MNQVDLLLNPSWIIPIEPTGVFLEDHSIAVKDGKIVDLLPAQDAKKKYLAATTRDLKDHVVLPGFINAHTHSPMTLLRGLGSDLPLMDWLNKAIWPVEKKFIGEDFIRDGTNLAILEMISSGTTCFNEQYSFPDIIADSAVNAGIRAGIGGALMDFSTAWAKNSKEGLEKSLKFIEQYKNHPLITPTLAPHAPYTLQDEVFLEVKRLAEEFSLPVHLHLHETEDEINVSLKEYNKRPIKRLYDLGFFEISKLQCVHMTRINDEDLEIISKVKPTIIHCPESNAKLASGHCPVTKFLDVGANVALGTDSVASNNDLSMLGEMKTAALFAKYINEDATKLPVAKVLQMATLNGARALGIDSKVGSLKVGKEADMIAIDLSYPQTQPLYDPMVGLVYSASRNQVKSVWVKGKELLQDGDPIKLDKEDIIVKAKEWGLRIKSGS